ncbi:MAG: TolC family protein [Mucilaginibacter polytrichastri]|nr:TolC family protein [Mucilaginibacter polytrichastri]
MRKWSVRFLFTAFLLPFSPLIFAQNADTLRLTPADAEKRFLENNLDLLIKKYDIGTAEAEIITARLFENPEVSYENIFYNPESRKFFQTSMRNGQGQYEAHISQLFKLAGKRNKAIKLAESGAKMAGYEFFDLMRTLRFSLRSTFNTLHYAQSSARVFDSEISSLQKTLAAFERQYANGNVSAKEVLRIKSLLYTLQGQHNALLDDIEDAMSSLRQLTLIPPDTYVMPVVDSGSERMSVAGVPYQTLLDSAITRRSDMLLARENLEYAGHNLRLQKAMAVPDLTVSGTFDLQSNSVTNYTGLGVAIALPFFNRNQGAIKQARIAVDAGAAALRSRQVSIENEVAGSYRSALRTEKLYAGFDPEFSKNFESMVQRVNENYLKRNIGLLEFIDFYESYKDNTLEMNNLRTTLANAREELNYVTGTTLFKP